jgi:multidrug efflux system membrane fusion protein
MEDKTKQRVKFEGVPGAVPVVTSSEPHPLDDDDTPSGKPWIPVVLVLALIGVLAFWFLTNKEAPKAKKPPAVPVAIAPVEVHSVPLEIRTIGNVTPINSVAIKSRVQGHITKIFFKEGQNVHKGDLLFTIDARPLQAGVSEMAANVAKMRAGILQAEATVKRDRALLDQAVANKNKDIAQQKMWAKQISRYSYLQGQGAVSDEQVDQTRASADAMTASVAADEAAIANCQASITSDLANLQNAKAQLEAAQAQMTNANLNLDYTNIRSPMEGRTGSLLAFEGNLVKAEDATLVTINQVKPIHVTFGIPEQALPLVRQYQQQGTLAVFAYPPGAKGGIAGTLSFSENAVDSATGTIRLKAEYPNANSELWPGQFVDVVLRLTDQPNAIVVPQHAVQSGQRGDYVYVVDGDKVHFRSVKVDRTVGDWTVLASGVKVGEQVVTDGQLQLNDGSKILLKNSGGAAKP